MKVSSVEFNVDKIRTAATPYWNNPHANLDPTNSPTQFELSSDALCKVCTRVLVEETGVALMVTGALTDCSSALPACKA